MLNSKYAKLLRSIVEPFIVGSAEKAAVIAAAIKATGTGAHGKVGIYAPNVPQWMVIIQACNRS